MRFICYPRCTTCKKAQKWLDENNHSYEFRDIKQENPTIEEIKEWHQKSQLPLKRFFNTSGLAYRSLGLKDQLPTLSEEEQYKLLSSDGLLVKRPILISEKTILVGFKQTEWEEKL